MLHRQLRNALEEIFGSAFIEEALANREIAHLVLYDRPDDFKRAVLGFQRLNFRDEHTTYATELSATWALPSYALCSTPKRATSSPNWD